MPKRVIDFDALWASDKLAACAVWAQAEYAWLYGLADANGSFELTNLRVIWGRVAAIRKNLSLERLEQIFDEFRGNGLLFVWEQNGKTYAHWTNSDLPGRLPPPSWRQRLERLAPPVPLEARAEYVKSCSRPCRSPARGSLDLTSQGVAAQAPGAPLRRCHSERSAAEAGCDFQLGEEFLQRDSSPRQTPSGLGMTDATLSPAPHSCHSERSAAEAGCDFQLGEEFLQRDSSPRQTPSGLGMTVATLSPAPHSCHSEPAAAGEESLSETCFSTLDAEPIAEQIGTEEALRSPIRHTGDSPKANKRGDSGQALRSCSGQACEPLKPCLEVAQAQDWDLDREGNLEEWEGEGERGNPTSFTQAHTPAPSRYADKCHSEPGQAQGELHEESLSSGCSPPAESGTPSAAFAAGVSPATCDGPIGRDSLARRAEHAWQGTTAAAGEKTASGTLALRRDSSPRQTPPGFGMTVATLSPAPHSCHSEPAAGGEESLSETCFAALLAEPTAAQIVTEEALRDSRQARGNLKPCLEEAAQQGGVEARRQGGTHAARSEEAGMHAQESKGAGKQGGTQTSCPEPVETHAPRCAYRGLRLAISERQDWLLSEAFPWVERQAEYRKMESWLEANPLRRPKNASRFAHNWFSKIEAPTSSGAAPEGLSLSGSHTEFTTGGSPQGFTTSGHSQLRTALSEARVGMGPQEPVRVKPEYWEKLRQREEARRTRAPKSFREVPNSERIKT